MPHNVVLVPLGDDFRYSNEIEFDQQYKNYIQIMEFINSNNYSAHISFGTLKDYFKEVRARMSEFPTLTGDFHVYSDIFSEGKPAYWSGYYFTRPYLKLLSRQASSKLRLVEILYTISLEMANKAGSKNWITLFESQYSRLTTSRRSISLFQHHDAITGTSKSFVMDDYEKKLNNAIADLNFMEAGLIQYLLTTEPNNIILNGSILHSNWRNKGELAEEEEILTLKKTESRSVILVNSLARPVEQLAFVRCNTSNVCVYDHHDNFVEIQVVPADISSPHLKMNITSYDVWFKVPLDPLSVKVFRLKECEYDARPTTVYCNSCASFNKIAAVKYDSLPEGSLQLENNFYRLLFDPKTRLLRTITNKVSGVRKSINLKFSSYMSKIFRSGAYLFNVEEENGEPLENLPFGTDQIANLVVVSGSIFSQVHVVWMVSGNGGPATFQHSVRLIHGNGPLSEAVHLENLFDFGKPPNFRDTELFMRIESDILNGKRRKLFTDQAGHGMVERVYSQQANLEGKLHLWHSYLKKKRFK